MRAVAEGREPGTSPTESRNEDRLVEVLHEVGAAPLVPQVVVGDDRQIGRTDFRDPDLPMVAEVNSLTFHTTRPTETPTGAATPSSWPPGSPSPSCGRTISGPTARMSSGRSPKSGVPPPPATRRSSTPPRARGRPAAETPVVNPQPFWAAVHARDPGGQRPSPVPPREQVIPSQRSDTLALVRTLGARTARHLEPRRRACP